MYQLPHHHHHHHQKKISTLQLPATKPADTEQVKRFACKLHAGSEAMAVCSIGDGGRRGDSTGSTDREF